MAASSLPVITSLSPRKGDAGTNVVIRGHYLDNALVFFGGRVAGMVIFNNPSEIVVVVPTGASKGAIEVRTAPGSAYTAEFEPDPPSPGGGNGGNGGGAANWWQRVTGVGSIQQAARALMPAALIGGVAGAAASVRGGGSEGASAVGNVVTGVQSVSSAALNTGAALGMAVIEGIARPFGASGSALTQLAGSITRNVTGLFESALGGVGNLLKAGGRLAGAGVGLVGAGVGIAAGGAIGGGLGLAGMAGAGLLPGALVGAAVGAFLGLMTMKIVDAFSQMLGGILGAIGKTAGAIGDILTTAFRTVVSVLDDVTGTAERLATAALKLSQSSGMSVGQSSNAIVNGLGFGISPQAMQSALGTNLMYQAPMAAAWGVRGAPGSSENMASFRDQYQSFKGMMGGNPLIANMMAQNMGRSEWSGMANLPDRVFNRQMQTSQSMNAAFGFKPGEIAQIAQEWTGLKASASQFTELLKTRLAADVIPYLSNVLGNLIDYVKTNGPAMSAGIKRGVETGVHYLGLLAKFLYADFPLMMVNAAQFIVRGVGIIAEAAPVLFDTVVGALKKFKNDISGIVSGIKSITDLLGITKPGAKAGGGASAGGGAGASVRADSSGAAGGGINWGKIGLGLAGAGLAAALIKTPVGAVTALGVGAATAAGAGYYRVGQRMGLIDRTQSFGDRMATGWGRVRDAATFNPGHYDKAVNQQRATQIMAQREAEAREKAANRPGANPILKRLGLPTSRDNPANIVMNTTKSIDKRLEGYKQSLGSRDERAGTIDKLIVSLDGLKKRMDEPQHIEVEAHIRQEISPTSNFMAQVVAADVEASHRALARRGY